MFPKQKELVGVGTQELTQRTCCSPVPICTHDLRGRLPWPRLSLETSESRQCMGKHFGRRVLAVSCFLLVSRGSPGHLLCSWSWSWSSSSPWPARGPEGERGARLCRRAGVSWCSYCMVLLDVWDGHWHNFGVSSLSRSMRRRVHISGLAIARRVLTTHLYITSSMRYCVRDQSARCAILYDAIYGCAQGCSTPLF